MEIKNVKRASLKEYSSPTGVYVAGQRCWNVDDKAHIALPCATQVRLQSGTCCLFVCACSVGIRFASELPL